MTAPELDENQRALLADVVDGNVSIDDPAVVALLALHPSLREEIEWMGGAVRALDRAGEDARAEIAAATGVAPTPGERELLRGLIARELGDGAGTGGAAARVSGAPRAVGRTDGWASRRRFVAAAASVFVAGAIGWQWWSRSRSPEDVDPKGSRGDVVLSDEPVSGYSPAGLADDLSMFRWPTPPAPGDYYRVRILEHGTERVVLESPPLSGSVWRTSEFDREELAALSRFVWQLVLEVVGGDDRIEASTEVWR